jgi:hypothetical protein
LLYTWHVCEFVQLMSAYRYTFAMNFNTYGMRWNAAHVGI